VVPAARPSRSRLALAFVAFSALVIAAAAPAAAQILYGSVVGIVKDTTGGRLPGATVTVVNRATNLTMEVVTDTNGAYNLVNVQPGSYDVKVSLPGFRPMVQSSVPVVIGEVSRVDVALQIGTVSETITVVSSTQLLQTCTRS
jgi:hypothetical protein